MLDWEARLMLLVASRLQEPGIPGLQQIDHS